MKLPRKLISLDTTHGYYDIVVSGNLILKITKFVGDSQMGREVRFDDLHESVQDLIQQSISDD